MVLAIRTDQPIAQLSLCDEDKVLEDLSWSAGRNLSGDIHKRIAELLSSRKISYYDLKGLVFYSGPGSFTGLRIGASVFNTLAAELNIPIAGVSGENWLNDGLNALKVGNGRQIALPNYGGEAKTTKPKK